MIAASSPECAAAMSASVGCPRLHGFRGGGRRCRGTRRKHVAGQQAREGGVHAVHGIADPHRREGVAVVSAADAQEPLPLRVPGRGLELHRQLQRHLHGHRTRVREEHPLQGRPSGRGRGHVHQPLGQFHRRGMREAAEHHMAETLQLPPCGGVQHRVAVAVDHRPPRGHRIHHLMACAVLAPKLQPHAVGRLDLPQRKVRGRRRVRVPQPRAVPLDQARLRRTCVMVQAPRGGSIPPTSPAASPGLSCAAGRRRSTAAAPSRGVRRSGGERPTPGRRRRRTAHRSARRTAAVVEPVGRRERSRFIASSGVP